MSHSRAFLELSFCFFTFARHAHQDFAHYTQKLLQTALNRAISANLKGQRNLIFIVFRDILKSSNGEILKTPLENSIGFTRKSTDPLYSEKQSNPS